MEKASEQDIKNEKADEAEVYKSKAEKSETLYNALLSYFDDEMINLYNRLYTKLMELFETAEIRKDDWNNYSLL